MTRARPEADDGLPPIRLIASDLDGSLLDADGQLSERTIAAVRAADDAGLIVVAATGRSHRTAAERLAPAGVIRTAVCSNGGSVFDLERGEISRHRPLDDDVVRTVVADIQAAWPDVCLAWESPDGFGWEEAFVALSPPHVRVEFAAGRRAGELHRSIHDVAPTNLTKLLVGHPEHEQNAWLELVQPLLSAQTESATSGAAFVEVTGAGVNKASTLALVCADLGVDADEVAAFGDQSNDVAMLRWAGRSWAPANAHRSAVEAADQRAPHHAEDGVAQVIESLLS